MPYASKAQERFFHADAAKKKGISQNTVNEFDKASKGMDLPERKGKSSLSEALGKK